MEVWQKFKFNGSEYKIWEIYKAYEFHVKKRGDYRKYLPFKTDPRQGKNWKYFDQVYQIFSNDTMFDPFIFMEAQFRNVPKEKNVYPAQLKTKVAIDRYREHREAVKIKDTGDETTRILQNLADTFRFFKKWWKQNDFSKHSYREFFEKEPTEMMSVGMLFCIQGMVSKYFMAVSKSFLKEYEQLDPDVKWEVISPKELRGYRIRLKLDEDAYSFAKEIFNGEIL